MGELSPMMQNYLNTKKEYPGCILFYRLGDFYEMFFEDAELVSRELELTLTGKSCGLEERAPMCGVPYHAAEIYLNRLIAKGYKVAICEQVEDPKEAKGLVKREVTRIVTPGTNLDIQALDDKRNNYLMCIFCMGEEYGLCVTDITIGDFLVTELVGERKLLDEIYKFLPSEIICNEAFSLSSFDFEEIKSKLSITVYNLDSWYFDEESAKEKIKRHFNVELLEGLGLNDFPAGVIAAGAALNYLYELQKCDLSNINNLKTYKITDYMMLDASSRRNLELTETILDKQKRGSLLWVLDKTKTAMGARYLRSCVEQPLTDKTKIIGRLNAVEALKDNMVAREELREYLNPVYDLERLMGKIHYGSANPRDLLAFRQSLKMLPFIKELLCEFKDEEIALINDDFDSLEDIYSLIDSSIDEDAPLLLREGGIIKSGYNETVDELRSAKTDGKKWLASLEEKEKEKTGIKNLRIKYNKVFGYYFEVTNSFKNLVPDYYIRKQTLVNAERFTTAELKEMEDTILNAEDKLFSLEYDLFCSIRSSIKNHSERVLKCAHAIARLDAFSSLAYVAEHEHYVKPKINEKGIIKIEDGRHPVVEKMMNRDLFIANDTLLDNSSNRISIITGPNMAGKSTYMRQVALIVLMAQIGSFVPASYADIGIVDRIFTRVGASDDLSSGRSTFMVEMTEVANILRNATSKSLLILDEIGRGTATYDGLSIAWAVIEYIANTKLLGAKTLFATHYHELTELEGKLNSVNNYCIAVKEQGDSIVFLRKIVKGGADKSYGIAVAKLAGLPGSVIDRANELVAELMESDITASVRMIAQEGQNKKHAKHKPDEVDLAQMSLFETVSDDTILNEIKELDLNNMTPMDALNTLCMLKSKLINRW